MRSLSVGSLLVEGSLRVRGSLPVEGVLRERNYNTTPVVINNDPLLNLAAFLLALYVKNRSQVTSKGK